MQSLEIASIHNKCQLFYVMSHSMKRMKTTNKAGKDNFVNLVDKPILFSRVIIKERDDPLLIKFHLHL